MNCLKCPKTAKISHFNGYFCHDCYIDMIVARIRKDLRKGSGLSKGDNVLVHGELAKYFLKRVVEDLPIKLVDKGYNKIVIPFTADDEANLFYEEITKTKPDLTRLGNDKKTIKIFKAIADKELEGAAEILKIEFKPNKKSKDVAEIFGRYKAFSMAKCADEFKKAIK